MFRRSGIEKHHVNASDKHEEEFTLYGGIVDILIWGRAQEHDASHYIQRVAGDPCRDQAMQFGEGNFFCKTHHAQVEQTDGTDQQAQSEEMDGFGDRPAPWRIHEGVNACRLGKAE